MKGQAQEGPENSYLLQAFLRRSELRLGQHPPRGVCDSRRGDYHSGLNIHLWDAETEWHLPREPANRLSAPQAYAAGRGSGVRAVLSCGMPGSWVKDGGGSGYIFDVLINKGHKLCNPQLDSIRAAGLSHSWAKSTEWPR